MRKRSASAKRKGEKKGKGPAPGRHVEVGKGVEGEKRFSTIFEESADGLVIADIETKRFLDANKKICAMLGYEREEILSLGVEDIHPSEALPDVLDSFEKQLKEEIVVARELPVKRKDGSILHADISSRPITLEGRRCILGAFRDVTERTKAELALRQGEEMLAAALDAAELGIWDWDLVKGKIAWAGHHAKLLGYGPGEFDGRYETFEERIHTEDREKVKKAIDRSLRERSEYECDYRVVWPDGTMRWITGTGRYKWNEKGEPVRMLGVVRDITARKKTEEALRKSEARLRALFENISSGVAVYEAEEDGQHFVFKDINPAGERISRVRKEDIVGRRMMDVFSGVEEFGLTEVFREVWKTGEPKHHAASLYKDRRVTAWYDNYVYKLPTSEIVAVYRDVTEQKQAEEEVRAAKSFLDTVVDMSPFAMWVSDREGTLIRTNRSLRETLNLTDEQIIGKYNVLKDGNLETQGVMPLVRAVFESHEAVRFSIPWKAVAAGDVDFEVGRDLYIDVSMFPILDADGKLTNVVCQWVDITDRKLAEEALQENERQLATLMGNLPGMAYRCLNKPGWPMDFVSEGCLALTGYAPAELTNREAPLYGNLIHPDDRNTVWDGVQESVRKGDLFVIEYRLRDRKGAERWVWEQGRMVDEAVDGTAILEGFISDITERKRAEEEIQEKAFMIDSASAIIATSDLDGKMMYTNTAFLESWGFDSLDEVLGRPFTYFWVVGDQLDEVMAALRGSGGTRRWSGELKGRRKDGTLFDLHVSAATVCDSMGSPIALMSTSIDISERKKAEEELRIHREHLEDLVTTRTAQLKKYYHHQDALSELELAVSEPMELQTVLDRIAEITTEFLPVSGGASVVLWNDETERFFISSSTVAGQEPGAASLRVRQRKGATRWIVDHCEPLIVPDMRRDPFGANTMLKEFGIRSYAGVPLVIDGKALGVFYALDRELRDYSSEDIDFMKALALRAALAVRKVQLFRKLERANMRLAEANEEVGKQLRHVQKMEAVGTLAGGLAHDFNNILAGIIGYTSLLKKMLKDSPVIADLEAIEKLTWRGADITKGLLAFSRKRIYCAEPLNINPIIEEVSKIIGRTSGSHLEIKTELSPDTRNICGDKGQLHQVFINLFINACAAMPENGVLAVKTGNIDFEESFLRLHADMKAGPHVFISISDTGTGMDEKTRERIFEPFFTTKDEKEGTGLGLAVVVGIIQGHGGCIDVASEPGRGSVFTIYLPAVKDEVETEDSEIPVSIRGAETILLADDEEGFRKSLRRALEDLGYTVLGAANGKEAVRLLKEKKGEIDIVLLDMVMKGGSGVETFARMRELVPDLPIILCSGYAVQSVTQNLLDSGAVDYIQKPFDIDTLILKVRKVLDGP